MKVQELRVGNWVQNNKDAHPPTQIDLYSLSHYADIFEPIKLNEEWLIKFGFTPNGHGGYVKSWPCNSWNHIEYRVGRGMNEIGYSIWDASTNGMPEIKNSVRYVHELQNIWFWLTRNEELEVQPPSV